MRKEAVAQYCLNLWISETLLSREKLILDHSLLVRNDYDNFDAADNKMTIFNN